jgi:hypothetical protein
MKRPAPRPRRSPTAPGQDTGAFTFLDIGRRLRVLGEEYEAAERRLAGCVQCTTEWHQAKGSISLILDEELALQNLVLSMKPKNLEDAAVHLGCLFIALQRMGGNDLSSQLDNGDLERGLNQAERAAACLTSVICREAGANPADTGTREMSRLLASHCPSHVVEPDAAEVVA